MPCQRRTFLILAISALVFAVAVMSQQSTQLVDDVCIGCICEAASSCNRTVGCHNGMCGLFRITFPYWVDGGKPVIAQDTPDAPDAWVRCVTDPYCAAQTVQGYLAKFSKDCNSDGKIDCFDYASIHHLGGYGCNSRPLDPKYLNQFNNCISQVGHLQG